MAAFFRLKPQQRQDLLKLAALGPENLARIRKTIETSGSSVLTANALESVLTDTVREVGESPETITRVITSLAVLARHSRMSSDDLVSALASSLKTEGTDEPPAEWHEASQHLVRILELEATKRVAKALDLSYDYQNLLRDTRILCDVRPVFSDDDSGFSGAVISQSLLVEYRTEGVNKSISVALDMEDIDNLLEQCKRAKAKAETAKKEMSAWGVLNFAVGEEKLDED